MVTSFNIPVFLKISAKMRLHNAVLILTLSLTLSRTLSITVSLT